MMSWTRSIPNVLTLTHLFLGAWGAAEAVRGRLLTASALGLTATLLDYLDGFAARSLNASSDRGQQLDSLADLVSFGVLPALVLMRMFWLSHSSAMHTLYMGSFPLLSFLPLVGTLAAAWRLSGFNLQAPRSIFYGLPTPAHALFILSLPLVLRYGVYIIDLDTVVYLEPLVLHPLFLITVSLLTSMLMVAPMPMYALKVRPGGWPANRSLLSVLALGALLFVLLSFSAIPIMVLAYIILSLIKKPQT